MSEEEFEERQLTKLISDLRDINSYTDFKNGAFIYDLGHYQGLLLVNEIERLNNIINELDKELELERKSRQLLTDDLANVCEMSLKKDNIINKGIEAINVYQNEKTLSVGYEDLKRIRGILQGNEFDLRMFEEYLQELKGVDKE